MRPWSIRIAILFLLSVVAGPLSSGQTMASSDADESRMLTDARDGRFDHWQLLDAALAAEAAGDVTRVARARDKWERHGQRLQTELQRLASERTGGESPSQLQLAEQIWHYLHREILNGGYASDQSEVSMTLASGAFNCLSATIICLELMRDHNIPCEAVALPHHVAIRILDDEVWHVEPTNAPWHPLSLDDARATGARSLTDVALVSRIYYNRGLAAAERRDFATAVNDTSTSVELDPAHLAARENLLATLNNWSIQLVQEGQYEAAARLLAQGLEIDRDYLPLRRNLQYLHDKNVMPTSRRLP